MIWLTWRQFRSQAAVIYAALAVLGVTLVITGIQLADLSRVNGENFFDLFAADRGDTSVYNVGWAAVMSLPAIIGLFAGAPLIARELESNTHRLIWNQTVTRTRWLAIKVGLVGLAVVAATGLLSLAVTWWCGPIDTAINSGHGSDTLFGVPRIAPANFDARGIAPMGYALFAFAVGVTAGAVIRRTVPAMAVTLAVFVAFQIAMPTFVRPHLGSAQLTTPITAENLRGLMIAGEGPGDSGPVRELTVEIDKPGAWILANQTVDASGKALDTLPSWVADCGGPPGLTSERQSGCFARLAEAGYRQRVSYAPASQYWTLQAYETAIFSGVALLLIGFCFWWVRRLS